MPRHARKLRQLSGGGGEKTMCREKTGRSTFWNVKGRAQKKGRDRLM